MCSRCWFWLIMVVLLVFRFGYWWSVFKRMFVGVLVLNWSLNLIFIEGVVGE